MNGIAGKMVRRVGENEKAFADWQADFRRRRHGQHITGEHLPADKPAFNGVCWTDKLLCSIMRV